MLKSIIIHPSDHQALKAHVAIALAATPKPSAHWRRLHEELRQAEFPPPAVFPDDVVRLGSTFTVLDLDTNERDTFTLAWPEHADLSHGRLSVLTPLGAAVIGYTATDEIVWEMPRGPRRLRLVSVQPPTTDA